MDLCQTKDEMTVCEDGSSTTLAILGNHPVIEFAVLELARYLGRMNKKGQKFHIVHRKKQNGSDGQMIGLGLGNDFQNIRLPMVDNPFLDDAIYINIERGRGIIAGDNPRAVLLAVYRFLTEAGCRWLRPGEDGEYIPKIDITNLNIKVIEKAAYRHRAICIEGAVSYENLTEMIEWVPKVGFNGYFIQFREAFTFFERWHSHRNNPTQKKDSFSLEQAREYVRLAVKEIKERGLIYHAVGHGWTCEALEIPALGWDPGGQPLEPELAQYLAEVNLKREFWKGVPLDTNLCYSNIEVRNIIVENIISYLREHLEVDLLHFWLADEGNNHCECEACRALLPSDYYVRMLNELDERLVQEHLDTKIVFLVYFDLLWPPVVERIKNPGRFILMFAPITRSYSEPFTVSGPIPRLPVYQRNALKFPTSVGENIAHLRQWQAIFSGDSFLFDYHLWREHYTDPGSYKIAKRIHHDVKNLRTLGLNGFVSCQVQRAFFPTGLPMYVLGKTLWNDRLEFEPLVKDYFEHAFGKDGKRVRKYLATLSDLFDPSYIRGEIPSIDSLARTEFGRIQVVIEDFLPIIEKNILSQKIPCQTESWELLHEHAWFASCLGEILEKLASNDQKAAFTQWSDLKKRLGIAENRIQKVFDLYEFVVAMQAFLFSMDEEQSWAQI
jgi:hypothetical protein